MRSFALLCLLAFATPADAAAPEQHYLDLRDRYIVKFSKAKENDQTTKQHQDSAFAKYAELPITKPASVSVAVAVLGVRGNGDLKGPPQEIDVVAIQGDKVYFLAATDAVKTAEIPACENVRKQMMAKPVKKKDPRGNIAREDQAMTAFTACFAKEAQSQLKLLPLR